MRILSPPPVQHVPTAAVDTWALGCILFQMLVGRPPFRDLTSEYMTFEAVLEFSRTRHLVFPDHVSTEAKVRGLAVVPFKFKRAVGVCTGVSSAVVPSWLLLRLSARGCC